jgi:hypothetical protein
VSDDDANGSAEAHQLSKALAAEQIRKEFRRGRSASNAFKHGIFAKSFQPIPSGPMMEDPDEVAEFVAERLARLDPVTPAEQEVAEQIVLGDLRLWRAAKAERDALTRVDPEDARVHLQLLLKCMYREMLLEILQCMNDPSRIKTSFKVGDTRLFEELSLDLFDALVEVPGLWSRTTYPARPSHQWQVVVAFLNGACAKRVPELPAIAEPDRARDWRKVNVELVAADAVMPDRQERVITWLAARLRYCNDEVDAYQQVLAADTGMYSLNVMDASTKVRERVLRELVWLHHRYDLLREERSRELGDGTLDL